MWPFSSKPKDIRALPKVTDDAQPWSVAMVRVDEKPLIVRANGLAKKWKAHPELPIKLGFAMPLNKPNPAGLPDPEENLVLNGVEDAILAAVESRTIGFHALTLTNGEMKELILYIPEGVDIQSLHEHLRQTVTSHEVQCLAEVETAWETFQAYSVGG